MFNVLFNFFMFSGLVKLGNCDLISIDNPDINVLSDLIGRGPKVIQGLLPEVRRLQEYIQIDTSDPKNIGDSIGRGPKVIGGLQEVRRLQEDIQIDTSDPKNIGDSIGRGPKVIQGLPEVRRLQEYIQIDTSDPKNIGDSIGRGPKVIQGLPEVRRLQEYIQIDTSDPKNIGDSIGRGPKVIGGLQEVRRLQEDIQIDTSDPKNIGDSIGRGPKVIQGLPEVRRLQEYIQIDTSDPKNIGDSIGRGPKVIGGLQEVRRLQEDIQIDTSDPKNIGDSIGRGPKVIQGLLPEVRRLQEYIQIDTSDPKNIGDSIGRGPKVIQGLPEVRRLQEYIQIDTSDPKNIERAVDFWERQAAALGLPFTVLRPAGLPICIITVKGTKPELPSIILNSHADVVPVDAKLWTHPPFSGDIDDEGNLFGRGVQDCKSTGLQYLEAIRKLRQQNITLERTIYITVMPDEETGGFKGMVPFVKTKEFKSMNVGFALDEGVPSPDDAFYVLYTDKRPWQMKFEVRGAGGHGSILNNGGTAVEKVQTLINTAMAYRNQQSEIMASKAPTDFGTYTTCNMNMIYGGIAANVVPSRMSMVIDARLAVHEEVSHFQSMINSWKAMLGNDTKLEYLRRITSMKATATDDSNPYWVAMRDTLGELGLTLLPIVCPATTDMVEIRALDIPALGFTTNRNMPITAHDVDEYIPVNTYLEGIKIYVPLIQSLANVLAC